MSQNENAVNSVLTVAKEILKQAEDQKLEITALKLIKLTYMAHGVSLAVSSKPLFRENVEAWKYGPVIEELYHVVKKRGTDILNVSDIPSFENENINDIQKRIIEVSLKKWGGYTGPQLSAATHQEGTPWYQEWHKNNGKKTFSHVIPNDLIEKHYSKLYFN